MDKEIALRKSEHYCAYQERSKLEVLNKLHEWDVSSQDMDSIIENLEKDTWVQGFFENMHQSIADLNKDLIDHDSQSKKERT